MNNNSLGEYAICRDSGKQEIYECGCYNCLCNDDWLHHNVFTNGQGWMPTLAHRLKWEKIWFDDIAREERRKARAPPCYRHLFLTISLDPKNFDSEQIPDWLPDLSIIQNHAIWCFEFYGKDLKFHPHIHLLIKTTKKLDKKRIIQKLSSKFNVARNFIDYKTGNNKHLFNKRVNYIKGIKSSLKNAQINADQKFRDEKNIKDFYTL